MKQHRRKEVNMYTVNDVIQKFKSRSHLFPRLPAPSYSPSTDSVSSRVCLAVEAMARHITDEGWQLVLGLQQGGYNLYGHRINDGITNVHTILDRENPDIVVVQDKREWEGLTASRTHDPKYRFTHIGVLRERPDIFKLTILKDAHHRPDYHRESADEMGCHGWITYYHPRIVHALAPYTRLEHIIRTYHTIKAEDVPSYTIQRRKPCVISGALSSVYPLRSRIIMERWKIPGLYVLPHPGYATPGPFTPQYLKELSRFKVSICTSSAFGYLLRKIIESTACGCRVISNLPHDEIVPFIDGNITRIRPNAPMQEITQVIRNLVNTYDQEEQKMWAHTACKEYDYRTIGVKLAEDIEKLRVSYKSQNLIFSQV